MEVFILKNHYVVCQIWKKGNLEVSGCYFFLTTRVITEQRHFSHKMLIVNAEKIDC